MISRVAHRIYFTTAVYGKTQAFSAVLRMPLSYLINGFASLSAIYGYLSTQKTNGVRKVQWDKTEHKFPSTDEIDRSTLE